MKKTALFLVSFMIFCCPGEAHATAPAPIATVTPQQARTNTCIAQYRQKKIDKSQYHQFMTQCLKNPPKDTPVGGAAK
jgi:hypothetical protein